eukprot:19510-Chlamydomonas_euryale.AAC.1
MTCACEGRGRGSESEGESTSTKCDRAGGQEDRYESVSGVNLMTEGDKREHASDCDRNRL